MSELADRTDQSTTWMLFESGNGVVVDLSLYSPSGDKTRPIDAYVVTECEGDFTASARRAAEAVYDVLQKKDIGLDPVVVGYDLRGLPSGRTVTGESGGLAFAVALAKRLLKQDPGPVAATGEVTSGHDGGPIGPVKGIAAKLEAAAQMESHKGWVLYPQENHNDVPEELRRSLADKGLQLQPVSSVAEVLDLLFELPKPQTKKAPPSSTRGRIVLITGMVLALVCISVLAVLGIYGPSPFEQLIAGIRSKQVTEKILGMVAAEKDTFRDDSTDSHLTVKIDLDGETAMGSTLAELTTKELETLFKGAKWNGAGAEYISGRIMIMTITEQSLDKKGTLSTTMAVSVNRLEKKEGKETTSLPLLRVSVKGKGLAHTLLPKAASALAREIVKAIARQDHGGAEPVTQSSGQTGTADIQDSQTSHGFD